jgi:putative glutamine amidotransferase
MSVSPIHVAIPEPTSFDSAYNQRSLPHYLHALHSAGLTPIPIPLHESPQRLARILASVQGILLPGSPADADPARYGEPRHPKSAAPDPARAAADDLLLQNAFRFHKPVLAICQGLQSLNVWRGGTLIQDIPSELGAAVNHAPGRTVLEAHPLAVEPGTRLASLIPHSSLPQQNHISGESQHERTRHASFRTPHHSDPLALPLHEDERHLWVNSSHHQAIRNLGEGLIISAHSPQDQVIEAVELPSPDHFVLAVQWHPERSYDQSAFSRNIFAAFASAAQSWTPRNVEDSDLVPMP